jgi:hypothetical protein
MSADDDMVRGLLKEAADCLREVTGYEVQIVATRCLQVDRSGPVPRYEADTVCLGTMDHHELLTDAAETMLVGAQKILMDHACSCPSCTSYGSALKVALKNLKALHSRPVVH